MITVPVTVAAATTGRSVERHPSGIYQRHSLSMPPAWRADMELCRQHSGFFNAPCQLSCVKSTQLWKNEKDWLKCWWGHCQIFSVNWMTANREMTASPQVSLGGFSPSFIHSHITPSLCQPAMTIKCIWEEVAAELERGFGIMPGRCKKPGWRFGPSYFSSRQWAAGFGDKKPS